MITAICILILLRAGFGRSEKVANKLESWIDQSGKFHKN